MRHAIEEEEKVPMEEVTNFQEVTLHGGREKPSSRALPWRLASFCSVFGASLLGAGT